MSRETKARVGMAVFVVVVFALGFVARGAVDRYRTADTDMTAMWHSVIPGSTMKLSSTPCYPVEALAPAVAHEFARLLNTSVEALMGVGRNSFVLRGELSEPYTFSCTMFPKGDVVPSGESQRPEEPWPPHSGLPIPYQEEPQTAEPPMANVIESCWVKCALAPEADHVIIGGSNCTRKKMDDWCTRVPKSDAMASQGSLTLLPSPLFQTCIQGYHEVYGPEAGTGNPTACVKDQKE